MRNLRWKRRAPFWYEAAGAAGVSYIIGPDRPSGYFVERRRALCNSEILARGVRVGEAKLIAARHASLACDR